MRTFRPSLCSPFLSIHLCPSLTYRDQVLLHEGREHVVSDGDHDITEVHGWDDAALGLVLLCKRLPRMLQLQLLRQQHTDKRINNGATHTHRCRWTNTNTYSFVLLYFWTSFVIPSWQCPWLKPWFSLALWAGSVTTDRQHVAHMHTVHAKEVFDSTS